jgi:hypothetical protein
MGEFQTGIVAPFVPAILFLIMQFKEWRDELLNKYEKRKIEWFRKKLPEIICKKVSIPNKLCPDKFPKDIVKQILKELLQIQQNKEWLTRKEKIAVWFTKCGHNLGLINLLIIFISFLGVIKQNPIALRIYNYSIITSIVYIILSLFAMMTKWRPHKVLWPEI